MTIFRRIVTFLRDHELIMGMASIWITDYLRPMVGPLIEGAATGTITVASIGASAATGLTAMLSNPQFVLQHWDHLLFLFAAVIFVAIVVEVRLYQTRKK